jgi:hypothetical protein
MHDPAYHNGGDGRGFRRVFIDGIEVQDVDECHTGQGWAMRALRNAEGNIYSEDGLHVARERIRGHVRVATPG